MCAFRLLGLHNNINTGNYFSFHMRPVHCFAIYRASAIILDTPTNNRKCIASLSQTRDFLFRMQKGRACIRVLYMNLLCAHLGAIYGREAKQTTIDRYYWIINGAWKGGRAGPLDELLVMHNAAAAAAHNYWAAQRTIERSAKAQL